MKKIIAIALAVINTALMCACNNNTLQTTHTSQTTQASTSDATAEPSVRVQKISDFAKLDGVESIKRGSFPYAGVSLFKLTFVSCGLRIKADILLPDGYEKGGMPLMIYSPNGYSVDNMKNICASGVCVARLYYRGMDGCEGGRDLGGEDWRDTEKLIEILKKADFWQNSKVICVGSNSGSVSALKTAAERPDLVDACAVIDAISDLGVYVTEKGESTKNAIDKLIGDTDDIALEYAKRSAVNFADKIKCETLVISYKDSLIYPESQSYALAAAINEAGGIVRHYRANAFTADLQGAAVHELVLFIKSVCGESVQKGGLDFVFEDGTSETERSGIVAEAEQIMAEINEYLGVSIADGIRINCIFDPNYVNAEGQKRSGCHYNSKTMYCVDRSDFVHEYIHMLLYFCDGGVYSSGDSRFSEGAAMYICNLWETQISSVEYLYFKKTGVREWQNKAEHEMIIELIEQNEAAYDNKNYNNALIAVMCREAGADAVLQSKNTEFINYYLGFTVVDYLISEQGGMERFIAFYQDRAHVESFYGKSVAALSADALAWNSANFQ